MLLEGKVGRERLLRENTLAEIKRVFPLLWVGGRAKVRVWLEVSPPGRPCRSASREAPWKTTALPPIRDTPMLCHSQDPEPPPTPGLGATGPPSLSSQVPGFPCWLQEDATVVAPSPPLKLLACKMGIPAAGGPK